ncbi:MAG TPA: MoaD/ThiS family protein, partial [Thermoplasmata archaeon]|nr:MoaD/ThiS family protein [Thermoplasmata archaeon]
RKKELEIEEGEKVQDVLDKLNIKYDFVVTFLDEKPVPIDEPLKENCKLKVLVVVSGG